MSAKLVTENGQFFSKMHFGQSSGTHWCFKNKKEYKRKSMVISYSRYLTWVTNTIEKK